MSSSNVPDPNQAAVAGMQADLANFPQNWLVNAAAETGGKVNVNGQTYDFTGLGNADQSLGMSDKMAQALLDIQNNFGPQYVQQRLAELQQSDPVGYAARQQLFDQIQQEANSAAPNMQMSQSLQDKVNGMLQNAGQLDDRTREQIVAGVRGQQAARGITLGNAPAAEEATALVNAQDQLRNTQQQSAESYLQSGISPTDIQYRKIQQDLSNLGAFQNNQTPEAQFADLSSAGNGSAPFSTPNYQTPATLNQQNGVNTGINFAQGVYNTSQQNSNPWLAGLSLGTSGLNAATNAGLFNGSSFTSPSSSAIGLFSSGAGPISNAGAASSFQSGAQGIQNILNPTIGG